MKEKNENKKRRSDLIKQLLWEYQPKSAADLQNMLKDLLGYRPGYAGIRIRR